MVCLVLSLSLSLPLPSPHRAKKALGLPRQRTPKQNLKKRSLAGKLFQEWKSVVTLSLPGDPPFCGYLRSLYIIFRDCKDTLETYCEHPRKPIAKTWENTSGGLAQHVTVTTRNTLWGPPKHLAGAPGTTNKNPRNTL